MEEINLVNPCKLCSQKEAKYVCPRCNIPYCSLSCYQAQEHLECSENFYKDSVIEQLKSDELDPQSQKKMLEILQRVQQIDDQFEEEGVDSDDDDDDSEETLRVRMEGVNLDDADNVWHHLTQREREQFEEFLRSGDISEVVPQWEPWWCYRQVTNLIEDNSKPKKASDSTLKYPVIKEDIQPLSKLSKVSPSPCVRWNLVNVLAAYAVTARVYNGDHHSSALEAATTLITLSSNLVSGQVYENPETAITGVKLAALSNNCFVEGVDENILATDVQKLVEGPSKIAQAVYVLSALSDIHILFTLAIPETKEIKINNKQGEFSKRFVESSISNVSCSDLKKCVKKIEYLLSWAKEYF